MRRQFFEENRREVRQLYRDLLKLTAQSIDRKLEREARLTELKQLFREYQDETDMEQINEMKVVFYGIVNRLELGIYPPFPPFTKI